MYRKIIGKQDLRLSRKPRRASLLNFRGIEPLNYHALPPHAVPERGDSRLIC